MLHPSLRHWLSLRIRLACIVTFIIGTILPPYIPKEALAQGDDGLSGDLPQYLLVEDGFLMKSSSLTEQGSRRAYAQGLIYTVQNNDSIERIASKYRIKADTVRWANNLSTDSQIKAGQQLVILPVDGVLHTVTRGQTLNRIAELYSVPVTDISTQNKIDGGFILAGQELIVPNGKPIIARPAQVALNGKQPGKLVLPSSPSRPAPASSGKPIAVSAGDTPGILRMPCDNCSYTQYFRPGHYAVDIQQRGGGPIFAVEAGTVIRADYGWEGGYGNVIEIDHGNGLVTLYAHNKELYVKKGDTVKRGQNISFMGNTGRVYGATGIHVHFEVRVNGEKKNPLLYLK
jgi:murein DD-endopeptidase MepM/ murein hydrolase activator NlpD